MQTSPRQQLMGFVVAVMTAAAGCGSGSASPTAPPAVVLPAGSIAGTVSANHPAPHVAVLTAAQLSAGAAVTMDISNGIHGHTLSLTAGQVAQIAARARVSVDSTTNPHSNGTDPHFHTVTFN